MTDQEVAMFIFKFMIFKRTHGGFEVAKTNHSLSTACEISWCAHFSLDRVSNIVKTLFVGFTDSGHHFNTFSNRTCRMCRKSSPCCRNSFVDIVS